MPQWRVTKYDPRYRNRSGVYRREEWTAASDIGRVFNGRPLELAEYLAIEDRYVAAALHFLQESSLSSLQVLDLETNQDTTAATQHGLADILQQAPLPYEGQWLSDDELARVCRLNLRSLLWCRLQDDGRFFIHFGHDYYMYIGSLSPCTGAIKQATELGLFVESFPSPYGFQSSEEEC